MSSPLKKIVNFKAKLESGSATYPGIIENISENGLYVRTALLNQNTELLPGRIIRVSFRSDTGDEIRLTCKVKWSYKTPPYGITESIGIEVLKHVSCYKNLLRAIV